MKIEFIISIYLFIIEIKVQNNHTNIKNCKGCNIVNILNNNNKEFIAIMINDVKLAICILLRFVKLLFCKFLSNKYNATKTINDVNHCKMGYNAKIFNIPANILLKDVSTSIFRVWLYSDNLVKFKY